MIKFEIYNENTFITEDRLYPIKGKSREFGFKSVFVYGDEGTDPHVHFYYDNDKGDRSNTLVLRLDAPVVPSNHDYHKGYMSVNDHKVKAKEIDKFFKTKRRYISADNVYNKIVDEDMWGVATAQYIYAGIETKDILNLKFLNVDWKNKKILPPKASYRHLYNQRDLNAYEEKELFVDNKLFIPDINKRYYTDKYEPDNFINILLDKYNNSGIKNRILIEDDRGNALYLINGNVYNYSEAMKLYAEVKGSLK